MIPKNARMLKGFKRTFPYHRRERQPLYAEFMAMTRNVVDTINQT